MAPGRGRAPVVILLFLVFVASCTEGAAGPDGRPTSSGPATPRVDRPLGQLSVTDPAAQCDASSCIDFEVTCPTVEGSARGTLVVFPSQGDPRGLVTLTMGGLGTGFTGINRPFVSGLAEAGFEAVIVSWIDPWLQSSAGDDAGPGSLGCRPATVIRWIHDNLYQDIGAPAGGVGQCGFCVTGNSGGASQIGYSLSFYGLGDVVDAAVLSGGPPHAGLDEGCLGDPGLAYDRISAGIIDLSYGFPDGGGPCSQRDGAFAERWDADSLDSGGAYFFPGTRIAFVFVEADASGGPTHGRFYLDELRAAATPMLTEEVLPGAEHTIQALPEGRAALMAALDGSP